MSEHPAGTSDHEPAESLDGQQTSRLRYVDALRGLAAVMVVTAHVWTVPKPAPQVLGSLQLPLSNLTSGVILFFLVSAFSLCFTMAHHERTGRRLASFYIHRAFRILPLYYAVLAYAVLSGSPFGRNLGVREWSEAVTLTYNLDPAHVAGFVPAGWTLSVEVLFYLVFPLLILMVTSAEKAVAWIGGSMLVWFAALHVIPLLGLSPADEPLVRAFSVGRIAPVLLLGMLVFYIIQATADRDLTGRMRNDLGHALTATGLVLLWCQFNGWIPPIFGDSSLLIALCYAAIFIGLALSPIRLLVNRVTCYLGTIAYSVYLIHPWVVYRLDPVYPRVQALSPVATLTFGACVALTLAITVVLATISYRLIERPGINLGRRLMRRLIQPGTSAPQSS